MIARTSRSMGFALLAIALASSASAQAVKVTLLDGRTVNIRRPAARGFATTRADSVVGRIVAAAGLEANIEVLAVDDPSVGKAAAAMDEGRTSRLLLYNPRFFDRLVRGGEGAWMVTGILAHEIGHHGNGHTSLGSVQGRAASHQLELAADHFAGVQLARLRATQAQALAMLAETEEDDTFSHPGRSARTAAVQKGWCRGMEGLPALGFAPAGGSSGCVTATAPRPSAVKYDFSLGAAANDIREREYPAYRTRYMLGGLAIVQKEDTDSALVAISPTVLPSVAEIEATAFIDAGDTSEVAWGIGFGADSTMGSGYIFIVAVDGTWGLVRKVSGEDWEEIREVKEPVPAIRKGLRVTNKIAVRINRGSVTLVANDVVLDTIDLGFVQPGRAALVTTGGTERNRTTAVFLSLHAIPK